MSFDQLHANLLIFVKTRAPSSGCSTRDVCSSKAQWLRAFVACKFKQQSQANNDFSIYHVASVLQMFRVENDIVGATASKALSCCAFSNKCDLAKLDI